MIGTVAEATLRGLRMQKLMTGLASILLLGACANGGPFAPLSEDQRSALVETCGQIPGSSRIKAAESPRKISYRMCKKSLLNELEADKIAKPDGTL